MRFALTILPLLVPTGCIGPDETISGYAGQRDWHLVSLGDAPYPAAASLRFPAPGEVRGQGPCNGFTATQAAPYPWIEIGPIAATRRACPDLAAETDFFAGLEAAQFAEVGGDVLILSGPEGPEMVFHAD